MHRACGRLAAAVGMLGNVTMSDPGPGRHASHVPSISTYLDISRHISTVPACTLGCSRWNTCPMHLWHNFSIKPRHRCPQPNFDELRVTVLATVATPVSATSATPKFCQVAPFTPSAINALITALGTAWCDLPR